MGIFPKVRGENKKSLKPPPRYGSSNTPGGTWVSAVCRKILHRGGVGATEQKNLIQKILAVSTRDFSVWIRDPYDPSKIEWDLTNGPLRKLLELLDTPGLGVRSVGPVGDFLDMKESKGPTTQACQEG